MFPRADRHVSAALVCACFLVVLARAAHAADGQSQDADALFREGKRLLGERDYAKACPLLEASFRADPGTGVLLAMAICHEGEAKLASAFADYTEVTKRAAAEGRADRATVARARAKAIEPKLSTLAILVPPAAARGPGFVITRDGAVVDTDAAIPLDGGRYVVEAKADGKRRWTATVELAAAGDRKSIAVPTLADLPVTAAPAAPRLTARDGDVAAPAGAPSRLRETATPTSAGHRGLAVAAVALGAVSIVSLGAAAFYGRRAMNKNDDSKNGCDGDVCNSTGKADRLAALSAGNSATVSLIVASAFAAAAVTIWAIDRTTRRGRGAGSVAVRGALAFDPTSDRLVLGFSISR